MSTKATAQTSGKPAPAQNGKNGLPIILFGKDEEGKQERRFKPVDADKAIKAAVPMKLRVLKVSSPETEVLAATAWAHLRDWLRLRSRSRRGFFDEATGFSRAESRTRSIQEFDAIETGHLVIAQETPADGWFEAIVVSKDKEDLTLRFRDHPKAEPVTRRRRAVALLKPDA